jgi:hypothetical protein
LSTGAKKSKIKPASGERGGAAKSVEQTTPGPVSLPKRGRSDGPKRATPAAPTSDKLTAPNHPDRADDYKKVMEALGTTDLDFAKGIYRQLISASSRSEGSIDVVALLFSLAAIKGKKSKDQFQAMLVAQAAVTHVLTMKHATLLGQADDLTILEPAERAYNKLARTFILQLEAINRLDTGGEQKVTVQNVSVSDGGQAIVGNVTQGAPEKPAEKTPALPDARQAPMPIIDTPARSPVPVKAGRNNDEPSST